MRRVKILIAVVLVLLYVLAGMAGLLEGVHAVNFGVFLFLRGVTPTGSTSSSRPPSTC